MTGLESLDKEIHNTYHDPKNKDILPIIIFFSVIFVLFKGAILFELLLWGGYYLYCLSNNNALNNNKYNVEKRKRLLDFRSKIVSGELDFKK